MDIKPVDISLLKPRLRQIIDARTPLEVDKIIQLTKLDAQKVNQNLASMLIKGFLEETEGGYTIQ